MYAYREVIILDDLQRLILSKPLPLTSGQSVEILVVAYYPATKTRRTWQKFFVERNRLLTEQPDEIKEFMPERTQLQEQHLSDPFEGWAE
jgi:hypothetical protein